MNEKFIQALRLKLRFKTAKGSITTEDLWDLTVESLDQIAVELYKKLQDSSQTMSFITNKKTATKEDMLRFEIVKYVLDVKLHEKQAAAEAAERKVKREKLLSLIAQKEDEALSAKSIEDLRAELNKL